MNDKFDFSSLYGADNFPELRILVDVAQKQVEDGKPLEDILIESLEFAVSQATYYHTDLICKANKKVSEGLQELAYRKAWPNLGSAARHALELEEHALKDEGIKRLDDIAALIKLRKKMMSVSLVEIDQVVKRDWIAENVPELLEYLEVQDGMEEVNE